MIFELEKIMQHMKDLSEKNERLKEDKKYWVDKTDYFMKSCTFWSDKYFEQKDKESNIHELMRA